MRLPSPRSRALREVALPCECSTDGAFSEGSAGKESFEAATNRHAYERWDLPKRNTHRSLGSQIGGNESKKALVDIIGF